jgi:DNA mismatch repair protein MutL
MSRIRVLPDTVASQVAAGEVVERPASVVKELVENSIDAGARKIEIMIRRGGISVVRVVDDGCGMDRDDALLSLERHATSKIRSAADLQTIGTLGFRGEALPRIASVARSRLTTREPDAIAGTEIIVNGGKIETVRDGGEAPGRKWRCARFSIICRPVENFFALKTRKAVTLSITFTCKRLAILRLPSLCCETTDLCFSSRRRQI